MDFAALRERLERLEREVSALREKCGGADGGCCTSKESKGSARRRAEGSSATLLAESAAPLGFEEQYCSQPLGCC